MSRRTPGRIAIVAVILIAVGALSQARAADCNGNGVPDSTDIVVGTSKDCDGNHIPDECEVVVRFYERFVDSVTNPNGVDASDIDGDGDPDLVVVGHLLLAWYENLDGAGTFGSKNSIDGWMQYGSGLFVGDLDGDWDPDVLAASYVDNRISWHENLDSAGTFGPRQVISDSAYGATDVFAADLDGDGDRDVLSASYLDRKVAWYRNEDGGSFSAERIVSTDLRGVETVFAADLDGDGDRDVLTGSQWDHTLVWFENTDGLGLFGPQQLISDTTAGPNSAVAADVDGDGDNDVVAAGHYGIFWFENLGGGGSFGPARALREAFEGTTSVSVVDFDGDGDDDVLATLFGGDRVVWFENRDGAGAFGPERVITATANGAASVRAADLDGDGDLDALVGSAVDDKVRWHENLSDDCDADGVPDVCQPDCNENGVTDDCDVASGRSIDCDNSGVPDECEAICIFGCDADGDSCRDDLDCDPNDATVWSDPGPVEALKLSRTFGVTRLVWSAPAHPGAIDGLLRYDTLRSDSSSDFTGSTTCVESDQTNLITTDPEPGGGAFFYLIRVENDCPGGTGSLGTDSEGNPRDGVSCP